MLTCLIMYRALQQGAEVQEGAEGSSTVTESSDAAIRNSVKRSRSELAISGADGTGAVGSPKTPSKKVRLVITALQSVSLHL